MQEDEIEKLKVENARLFGLTEDLRQKLNNFTMENLSSLEDQDVSIQESTCNLYMMNDTFENEL